MIEIPDKIQTVATIREVLSERTCHATLPNGKLFFGFTSKELPTFPLQTGQMVRVQLSVADFSRGEMIGSVEASSHQ
ncbi:MAG: hypothetical protein R3F13_03935 [Prosthecobacter sp.]